MSCVNEVGVKVNLASQQLLTYVSGLGPTLAKTLSPIERRMVRFAAGQTSRRCRD